MDEIEQSRIGGFDSGSSDSSEPPRRVSRLLLLWPLAGMITLLVVTVIYRPIDDPLMWWAGGVPCAVSYILANIAWRKAREGEDARWFVPVTPWLALGCLCVPGILFLNGALDHSSVEQHRQVVTRKILEHGRSDTYYYRELTSWRANKTHEKVMVSERWYVEAKAGDPAIVETHRGAFGIPLLVSVHRPQ
jgi:hypothetical protein